MKDMANLHYSAFESVRTIRSVCGYIKKIIVKYGLTIAKTASTPADPDTKLMKVDSVSKKVDPITYLSMVGSLLNAAIATLPKVVGVVSKFNSKPTEAHLTAVKRILRYLKEL